MLLEILETFLIKKETPYFRISEILVTEGIPDGYSGPC